MGKSERKRQHIIEKAAPIYNEKGISGAHVDDVLAAAKVARGCLYGHFESKEDLSVAVVGYLLKRNEDVIFGVVNRGKTATDKIHAYLNFNRSPLDSHIDGGCPLINMAAESDDNSPLIKQMVKDKIISSQKFFTAILNEGLKNGEFDENLNVKDFVHKMISAIEGSILICRILGTNAPMLTLIKDLKQELKSYLPAKVFG